MVSMEALSSHQICSGASSGLAQGCMSQGGMPNECRNILACQAIWAEYFSMDI
jgi:hypothetical protein